MTMSLGDQPAFPCERFEATPDGKPRHWPFHKVAYPGMTKREVFTAMVLTNPVIVEIYRLGCAKHEMIEPALEVLAIVATTLADAALAELEKPQDDSTSEPS